MTQGDRCDSQRSLNYFWPRAPRVLTFTPQADHSLLRADSFYHTRTSRPQRSDLCLSHGPLPHSTRTSFLRARTIFIHQWTFPFWSLWRRVRTFLYFANGPFSIAKIPLPITCGPSCSSGSFIHNIPSSILIHEPYSFARTQWTFPCHKLFACRLPYPRAELFYCTRFARESFYVTRSELFTLLKDIFTFERADLFPITCGHIQDACRTALMHNRNLSGSLIIARRRLTRQPLLANPFLS